MQRIIILHTNDIHGRVEGLARIATVVARIREENPETPVLYFDCGDVDEPTQRLSNVTKGAAMHRLLSAAGCNAAVTGNGAWMRYGPQILIEHRQAARYPLLVANLRQRDGALLQGAEATTMIEVAGIRLGLVGLSASFPDFAESFDLAETPAEPLVRELAAELRSAGADAVLLLSHMGLATDRELAASLSGDTLAILGAHTHNLLPDGELIEGVWIAQAGEYAEHLGRIDLIHDGDLAVSSVSVIPVTETIPQSPAVLAEAETIQGEAQVYLNEVIGELAEPLDYAVDCECRVGNFMADVLLERMNAEVAVVAGGHAFTGPLPAGPLHRAALWDVCTTTANPALVELTGDQLAMLLAKGLDLAFAADRPRQLRGKPRGLLHLSGGAFSNGTLTVGGAPIEPQRTYRVAGSDWEFEPYGGYAPKEWALRPSYDMPTILREAVEDYLRGRGPVSVMTGRLEGAITGDTP